MLHLALLLQRKYSGEPQYSNCKEFIVFFPKATPPMRQCVLPVAQYFHSPTKRTLALADLELIPLPTWSDRILGDQDLPETQILVFWQQSLLQQIQWMTRPFVPNLYFVLIPDYLQQNTAVCLTSCYALPSEEQAPNDAVFPVIHSQTATLTSSHGKSGSVETTFSIRNKWEKTQKIQSTKYLLLAVALRGFPYHGCPELPVFLFWL